MPSYRAGALVIGSLYWDQMPERQAWRARYFGTADQPEARSVPLPLRYGMYSRKRQCPTMVLSQDWAQAGRLGQALVLPFQREYELPELLEAARDQSYAEGPADRRLLKGPPHDPWCLLVAWLNPQLDKARREALLEAWGAAYEAALTPALRARFRMEGEAAGLIDERGCLAYPWPASLADLDLVFLTQTRPIRGNGQRDAYPNPAEIARESTPRSSYFLCNRFFGLRTAQDETIAQELVKLSSAETIAQNARQEGCLPQVSAQTAPLLRTEIRPE
ncbi:MAG: hypothetical protein RI565_09975 [Schleiferiaceae bacterium]|nr:hypothetical protein [Schleiferiaceae bacterium]